MYNLSVKQVKEFFGEKTYSRGFKYFEDGYVVLGVKKGDKLFGRVIGSTADPYRVVVELRDDTIYSRCSCPVGEMCKHGVALLLQWIKDEKSFIDADDLIDSLRNKDKDEIIELMVKLMEEDPLLVVKISTLYEDKRKVNLDAISGRIKYLLRGFLDYYEIPRVVRELRDVKTIADRFAKEESFREAVEIYIMLIEKGVDAFNNGVDDSNGFLGDFIVECIEDFNRSVRRLDVDEKLSLIDRIIKIVEMEDYGLDTEELFFGVVTRENIEVLEEKLISRIPRESCYYRSRILDILSSLYDSFDSKDDVIRVLKKIGLKDEEDYVRLAKKLISYDMVDEAFNYIRTGLKQGHSFQLCELYFDLLNQFLDRFEVDEYETIDIAIKLLSSIFFQLEIYKPIRDVLKKLQIYDSFIRTVKNKCNSNTAVSILLNDGYIDDAIEIAVSSRNLYPSKLLETADKAYSKGRERDAWKLVSKALKQDSLISGDYIDLLKFFAEKIDEDQLGDIINSINNVSIAEVFIEILLNRNQEYAAVLIERFIEYIDIDKLKKYLKRLDKDFTLKISQSWINEFINRSYIYYDASIEILLIMKEKMDEEEWNRYIELFIENNKGKKKLLKKMRDANLSI